MRKRKRSVPWTVLAARRTYGAARGSRRSAERVRDRGVTQGLIDAWSPLSRAPVAREIRVAGYVCAMFVPV